MATVTHARLTAQRELPEIAAPSMAKANLRKAEMRNWKAELGSAIRQAANDLGWSLKQFAGALERDERQIARWCDGSERPQMDALLALDRYRPKLLVRMSALDPDVVIETVVRVTHERAAR